MNINAVALLPLLFSLVLGTNLRYTFNLYSRSNPSVPVQNFEDGQFNKSKPLKIIIHGWLGSMYFTVYSEMRAELLKLEDCIIVHLDWSDSNEAYNRSVVFTRGIGMQLGNILSYLFKTYEHIHMIGHGLGAHLASYAAKVVIQNSDHKKKIGRITALNPSLPLYNGTKNRLNKDDATIVDVYHCDSYRFAIGEPVGTVDFYINGGKAPQPDCNDINISLLELFYRPIEEVFCSHAKCRTYFTMSFTRNMTAFQCDSNSLFKNGLCSQNPTVTFGYKVEPTAIGTYYLNI